MNFSTFGRLALLSLVIIGLASAAPSFAQDYPNKPIRLIVGFPPGGGVDLTARVTAAAMEKSLGQPLVVDNRSGAGGGIGADLAAKAAPDGYTLLLGNTGSMTINPFLYPKNPYHTLQDFAPVALISSSPLLVLVKADSPVKSLADLVALGKEPGKKITYGTGGSGSISHLTGELLMRKAGFEMVHIPYRGGSPAIADLLGGQIDVVIEGVPIATPLIQTKKLRALVVTDPKRLPSMPDVPTVVEAGYPDMVVEAWYGLLAPANTPAPVVARLNQAVNTALRDPHVRSVLEEKQGAVAIGGSPEKFRDLLKRELARWSEAVRVSGAKVE